MPTVVVIGSNSFSGSHFIDYLLEKTNYTIIGISRSPEKKAAFLAYKKRNSPCFQFHQLDLNKDFPKIIEILDRHQPEYVVNFAAQSEVDPSWKNPVHWYQTNVLALVNFLSRLKDRKYLKKYVHASTPEVYGTTSGTITEHAHYNPSTPYAASKAAADLFIQMLVKTCNFPAVSTRVANVYGPGQQLFKIIPRSVLSIKSQKKIPLHGGGYAVRAFIHVRDASDAVLKIMEQANSGEIYHISQTEYLEIRNIVKMICDKMNVDFATATEMVGDRVGQDAAYILDSGKVRKKLGWTPQIRLDQGITEVIEWVAQNWDVLKNEPLEYIHKE